MQRLFDSLRRHAIGTLALLPFGVSLAAPVSIEYQLTTLGPSGRYEIRYAVTNVSLPSALSGFWIDFDPALYDEASLLVASTGSSGWIEQILGSVSDAGLPAQYDAYQVAGTPLVPGDTAAGFTVQFTWLGSGTPGAQVFAVYDPSTLEVLATGLTTLVGEEPPPTDVPEPATAALTLLALAGVLTARRRAMPLEPPVCTRAAAT